MLCIGDLSGLFPSCSLEQLGPPSLPPHQGPANYSATNLCSRGATRPWQLKFVLDIYSYFFDLTSQFTTTATEETCTRTHAISAVVVRRRFEFRNLRFKTSNIKTKLSNISNVSSRHKNNHILIKFKAIAKRQLVNFKHLTPKKNI